ncbi:hypothetical protein L1049_021723 [Liquidambar formosana]|uniref:Protein-S-isoprenylcysteine O-methyltransferase n=1 Tax=Liquidambar formosana TaxID=63359 RepID=A0AAP0RCG6_LIQFO
MVFNYTTCRQLSQMLSVTVFFHCSEYILASAIHGISNVTLSSLLISNNYLLAIGCSLLEYTFESFFIPGLKECWWVSNAGLALVMIGDIIRKMGILTAGRAFTHRIRIYHKEDHELVTHGIYRIIRHPGYCGFLIWAIGIQIMLCNPFCPIAFAFVLWQFFSELISDGEYFLREFFGSQYQEYADQVPSGIPFVK